jgi:hypothetical protein
MQLEINLDLFPKEAKKAPIKKVPSNNDCCKFIVDNFLVDHRKNVYIHQLKIAKKLFAFIPDLSFWKWMAKETEKVYTLKDFLKPDKIRWLKIKLRNTLHPKTSCTKLNPRKLSQKQN